VGTEDFYVERKEPPTLVTLISRQVPCAAIELVGMVTVPGQEVYQRYSRRD
jgi:hypothetical protein